MDNNSPTGIKKPVPPIPPIPPHNAVPAAQEQNKQKMRILILCTGIFLMLCTIVFFVFIFCMVSAKKTSSQNPVTEISEVEPLPSDHESSKEPENLDEDESPQKPDFPEDDDEDDGDDGDDGDDKAEDEENTKSEGSKKADTSEDALPALNAKTLSSFEDSFFAMFDECPEIAQKERCLFAFLFLHNNFSGAPQKLIVWDGYGPTEFLKKFSEEISTPELAEIKPEKLSDAEKEAREDELVRLKTSIQEKIMQNRQLRKDDTTAIPHTFHLEIFTLVKKNPLLKICLQKAIDRFEQDNSLN